MVETLPATTRIDFAQYVDLTEFFTAATIPNGDYVAATHAARLLQRRHHGRAERRAGGGQGGGRQRRTRSASSTSP